MSGPSSSPSKGTASGCSTPEGRCSCRIEHHNRVRNQSVWQPKFQPCERHRIRLQHCQGPMQLQGHTTKSSLSREACQPLRPAASELRPFKRHSVRLQHSKRRCICDNKQSVGSKDQHCITPCSDEGPACTELACLAPSIGLRTGREACDFWPISAGRWTRDWRSVS